MAVVWCCLLLFVAVVYTALSLLSNRHFAFLFAAAQPLSCLVPMIFLSISLSPIGLKHGFISPFLPPSLPPACSLLSISLSLSLKHVLNYQTHQKHDTNKCIISSINKSINRKLLLPPFPLFFECRLHAKTETQKKHRQAPRALTKYSDTPAATEKG